MSYSESSSENDEKNIRYDPVLLHARRESLVILACFCVCLVWSASWCYLNGYNQPAGSEVSKILGMPSWVFWGVLVPWLSADVFIMWFTFFFMAEDPLGESKEKTSKSLSNFDGGKSEGCDV
jgi:hypothetical protein